MHVHNCVHIPSQNIRILPEQDLSIYILKNCQFSTSTTMTFSSKQNLWMPSKILPLLLHNQHYEVLKMRESCFLIQLASMSEEDFASYQGQCKIPSLRKILAVTQEYITRLPKLYTIMPNRISLIRDFKKK